MQTYRDVWTVEKDYRDGETLVWWLQSTNVETRRPEKFRLTIDRDTVVDLLVDFLQLPEGVLKETIWSTVSRLTHPSVAEKFYKEEKDG